MLLLYRLELDLAHKLVPAVRINCHQFSSVFGSCSQQISGTRFGNQRRKNRKDSGNIPVIFITIRRHYSQAGMTQCVCI